VALLTPEQISQALDALPLSEGLASILESMLQVNPQDRASACEVRAVLRPHRHRILNFKPFSQGWSETGSFQTD
jgi:hypothetical protein